MLYDLDHEAAAVCREIGLTMVRAEAVNDDPRFLDTMAGAVMQTWNRYRLASRCHWRRCRNQLAWKARRRFDRRLRLGSPLTSITGAASSPARMPSPEASVEDRQSEGSDRSKPGALDVTHIRLSVRRDAYGRTPVRIVRSAFEFCVRTVSHTPRNPGATPSFTGTR